MTMPIFRPLFPIKSKNRLEIFILGHNQSVLPPRKQPFLHNIDLNELNIGIWNTDQLSENRIYFSDLNPVSEYIGLATHQWDQKFPWACRLDNLGLLKPHLKPNIVWYPRQAPETWATDSELSHPGIGRLLTEASNISGLSLNKTAFWCNCFICHREVYLDFLVFFHSMFNYFHTKYQFNFPYGTIVPNRHAAYFYERITALYFSNRKDLQLKQIRNEHELLF